MTVVTASELEDRAHPKQMDTREIQEEASEIAEILGGEISIELDEAIHRRLKQMATILEIRLNEDYPDCPECGQSLRQTDTGEPICDSCMEPLPDEIEAAYWEENHRIWNSEIDE